MALPPPDDHRIRDRFVAFAFAAADAVIEVSPDGRIAYAAGAIESMTRRTPEALVDRSFGTLIAPAERNRCIAFLAGIPPGGRLTPALIHLEDGREVMLGACRLPDEPSGSLFVTLTQPIARPQAASPDDHDRSSGVLTRSGFVAALSARVAEGADKDRLALLDVEGLDKVMAGSDDEHRGQLLAAIGGVLRQAAGRDGVAGRLGVSRFSVVGSGPIDGAKLSERLASAANAVAPAAAPISARTATVSLEAMGLSTADAGRAVIYAVQRFAQDELSVDDVAALGPELPALLAQAAEAVGRLRETIRTRNVRIALQPIVTLDGGAVHHHEVLCRLADGSSPGLVVSAAEQAGLAPEFDLMMADQTFAVLAAAPFRTRETRVAINISGRSIESPDFVRALEAMLDRRRGRPADILFEITETASIANLMRATEHAARLRGRGHPICIDDLGAGAASFQYLGAFDVDFAKIDGRYIRNAATDPRDKAFLVAMIGLCRNLDIPVIAESIETPDQARASQAMGATLGQGYHFGRPKPVREVLDAR